MEETRLSNNADVLSHSEKSNGSVTHISRALRTIASDGEIAHVDLSDTCNICGLATGDQCRPSCQWEPHTVIFAMR